MIEELTKKQKRILQFIAQKIWQDKRAPTIREIGQNFKFSSTGTVRDYLRTLQKKGYIRLAQRKSRAIELINENLLRVPILAQVSAGKPTLTYTDIEGYLDLGRLVAQEEEQVFALRVKGDSMIEAGIMPEDLVLVRRQPVCRNGQIIVALIDDEITIKYFHQRKGKIYLQPANKNYPPILAKDNFSVIGRVISVMRKYV